VRAAVQYPITLRVVSAAAAAVALLRSIHSPARLDAGR